MHCITKDPMHEFILLRPSPRGMRQAVNAPKNSSFAFESMQIAFYFVRRKCEHSGNRGWMKLFSFDACNLQHLTPFRLELSEEFLNGFDLVVGRESTNPIAVPPNCESTWHFINCS